MSMFRGWDKFPFVKEVGPLAILFSLLFFLFSLVSRFRFSVALDVGSFLFGDFFKIWWCARNNRSESESTRVGRSDLNTKNSDPIKLSADTWHTRGRIEMPEPLEREKKNKIFHSRWNNGWKMSTKFYHTPSYITPLKPNPIPWSQTQAAGSKGNGIGGCCWG